MIGVRILALCRKCSFALHASFKPLQHVLHEQPCRARDSSVQAVREPCTILSSTAISVLEAFTQLASENVSKQGALVCVIVRTSGRFPRTDSKVQAVDCIIEST